MNHSFFVRERVNERFAKTTSVSLIYSFIMSALSKSLTVALCHEQPERFTHGCSFVMRNLSNSLTVAHFSSAIWANCSQLLIKISNFEQMSKWAMSQWANSQPWILEVQIQNLNPLAARYIKEQSKQKMWNLSLKNYFFTLEKASFWFLKKKTSNNFFLSSCFGFDSALKTINAQIFFRGAFLKRHKHNY